MKRILGSLITFVLILFISIGLTSCRNKSMEENMDGYINNLMNQTTSYVPAWNKESFKGRWNYIDGVFLNSIVSLYYTNKIVDEEKASKYKDFFLNYINYYIDNNGNFINPETKKLSFNEGELDSICESRILFDAYEMTSNLKYLKGIKKTYDYLMEMDIVDNSYGNFSHKSNYLDQVWLDGMYMYVPFYARYALATSDNKIFDTIKSQYQFIREKMFDEEKKLYHHGYSSTGVFWSNYEEGCSESFWLRSMGWYIVSLVDVLDYFPEGNNKEYLKTLLGEAIEGIMQYQDENSKMFYQVVDKGNISVNVGAGMLERLNNTKYLNGLIFQDAMINNYLESSGSSMIAYALMKGAKRNYIDNKYLEEGKKVFEGIYNHSFNEKNNTLNDICITAGLGPEGNPVRDGSIEYYLAEPVGSNDAKGVGPFIMAYIEYNNETIVSKKYTKFNFVSFIVDNEEIQVDYVINNTTASRNYNFYKEGYEISDWYIDSDFTTLYNFKQDVNSNFNIYAKWIEKEE